jgi:hypothetical protein
MRIRENTFTQMSACASAGAMLMSSFGATETFGGPIALSECSWMVMQLQGRLTAKTHI